MPHKNCINTEFPISYLYQEPHVSTVGTYGSIPIYPNDFITLSTSNCQPLYYPKEKPVISSTVSNSEETRRNSKSDEEDAAKALLLAAGGPRREEVEQLERIQQEQDSHMKTFPQRNPMKPNSIQSNRISINTTPIKLPQTLVDSHTNVSLQSQSILSNFPSLLHTTLSQSNYAGSVLEWLPHGRSWRVLRWDALLDHVLPNYFSEFCNNPIKGDNAPTASQKMNSFLTNVQYWGFKEIKKLGADMGSYRHEFFIRENPELCLEMCQRNTQHLVRTVNIGTPLISRTQNINSSYTTTSTIVSPPQPNRSNKNTLFANYSQFMMSQESKISSHIVTDSPKLGNKRKKIPFTSSPDYTCIYQYRCPANGTLTASYESPLKTMKKNDSSFKISYQTPLNHLKSGTPSSVRSTRGGLRLCTNNVVDVKSGNTNQNITPTQRITFPVSNRGKVCNMLKITPTKGKFLTRKKEPRELQVWKDISCMKEPTNLADQPVVIQMLKLMRRPPLQSHIESH